MQFFRGRGGRFVVAGLACLALGGIAVTLALGAASAALGMVAVGAALFCFQRAFAASREERYDLRRLFDAPPPEPEDPRCDDIPEGEIGAPYCGWCDEAYPPGTARCRSCNRPLA